MTPKRVVIVRGHQATPWELRPWEELPGERFDVSVLVTKSNPYDLSGLRLRQLPVRTRRDRVPVRAAAEALTLAGRERYVDLERHLEGSDIVHAEELSYWFAAEAARHRRRLGYRLVLTVWETIPMLDVYRNPHARRFRELTLAEADLFLAATERARDALLLEGVDAAKVRVCPPGIDLSRFAGDGGGRPAPAEHLVLSPARLVWEKGHQDV
ncbi:MAG TPA: glycosyltransferase, partial [Thermoleophilaceae bacterium]|nr:glycosyltransferase [Thermoleophilaceae bacterium]